jgi:hypothetical protein
MTRTYDYFAHVESPEGFANRDVLFDVAKRFGCNLDGAVVRFVEGMIRDRWKDADAVARFRAALAAMQVSRETVEAADMSVPHYTLICLMEECAEIAELCSRAAVRVAKALRFGLSEVQPGQLEDNATRITHELADLLALAERLEQAGVISRERVDDKEPEVRQVPGVRAGPLRHGGRPAEA